MPPLLVGVLSKPLAKLFDRFAAKLVVIVIEIRLCRDVAYDYGWDDLTLTPKTEASRFIAEIACGCRAEKQAGHWKL